MWLKKLKIKLFHLWFLMSRPMTLGVRLVVPDENGKVLLVRHGYIEGWHLPGGGVETNETAEDTVRKELLEETGLAIIGATQLFGVYANRKSSKRDHVLLYVCPGWREERAFMPNREIVEIGFFDLQQLPEGTTLATRERLAEVYDGRTISALW